MRSDVKGENTIAADSVLVLSRPPAAISISAWYGHIILGLPFLLRILHSLQHSGVRRILVWTEEEDEEIRRLITVSARMPSVEVPVEIVAEAVAAYDLSSMIIVVEGSCLYGRAALAGWARSKEDSRDNRWVPLATRKSDPPASRLESGLTADLVAVLKEHGRVFARDPLIRLTSSDGH